MTHIITSLCIRDRGCIEVCPVECIVPGQPVAEWPWMYIDPDTCIDCGACVPECPYAAIFPEDEVPAAYTAKGGEYVSKVGLTGHYEGTNHHGKAVVLETTKQLAAGEVGYPAELRVLQERPRLRRQRQRPGFIITIEMKKARHMRLAFLFLLTLAYYFTGFTPSPSRTMRGTISSQPTAMM